MLAFFILLAVFFALPVAPAHAFYPPPYPYVLTTPVDILPQGSETILLNDATFYYSNGMFYRKLLLDHQYVAVPPPIGAIVPTIPQGYQVMVIDGEVFYEYNGVYYRRVLEGYRVMFPPSDLATPINTLTVVP